MDIKTQKIGFIGLGAMGHSIARNILQAGFDVTGCDINPEARQRWTDSGGRLAEAEDLVQECDILVTSTSSSESFQKLAETFYVPHMRAGQVFIDFGTVVPNYIRDLADRMKEAGASLLDCPVTGGEYGARDGTMRIFVGGDKAVFERMLPLFQACGDPDRIAYCGPSGSGQIVKGVNQLGMGMIAAAAMEAVAYGVRAGIDPDLIGQLVGGGENWRNVISRFVAECKKDNIQYCGVKYTQLGYFIEESHSQGYPLPIAQAVRDILKDRPDTVKEANQWSPSFWDALNEKSEEN